MADQPIKAYKGFDADLKCRGYQFETGGTYEHPGEVEVCASGFHACLNPFDVWNYYDVVGSRFCEVTLSGETKMHGKDTKIAARRITIEAELKLPDFIRRAVDWLISETKGKSDDSDYAAQIGSSGNDAQIGSSGNAARIGSSGYAARIGSSGNAAQIGSSGNDAQIGSSGNDAQIGSSGNAAQIGSNGNAARIGSSGNAAQIGSSGNAARIGSSGNYSRIDTSGARSVVASAGDGTRVKGAEGTWISLAEFDDAGKCVGFATGCIGRDGLKEGVWYSAQGGKLVEA